ncbi:MAG: hypothetical protein J6Y08_04320 [Clostridiales bacterium]|nr:hypothetical protein [Clostridiales bacterium]
MEKTWERVFLCALSWNHREVLPAFLVDKVDRMSLFLRVQERAFSFRQKEADNGTN